MAQLEAWGDRLGFGLLNLTNRLRALTDAMRKRNAGLLSWLGGSTR